MTTREPWNVAGIYYTDDLLEAPFDFRGGAVTVPDGPGMGIDVDGAKIEKYRSTELD